MPNNTTGARRFHLGEPITVKWQAPQKHSRKDWIGLYRVRSFCYLFQLRCNALFMLGWSEQVHDSHQSLIPWHVAACAQRGMGRERPARL